jgi:hypothetical protein
MAAQVISTTWQCAPPPQTANAHNAAELLDGRLQHGLQIK